MKLSEAYPEHPQAGIKVGTRLRKTGGYNRNGVYIVALCSLDPLTVGLVSLANGNLWCRPVEIKWMIEYPIPRDIIPTLLDIDPEDIADLDDWEILP